MPERQTKAIETEAGQWFSVKAVPPQFGDERCWKGVWMALERGPEFMEATGGILTFVPAANVETGEVKAIPVGATIEPMLVPLKGWIEMAQGLPN